jgi:hypothetical protein
MNGSEWNNVQMWITNNLVSGDLISGGFQVNISYFGVALIAGFLYWRHKAIQKKIKKALAKG